MKTMKKNYLGIGLAAMSLLAIGCTKDYSDDANGMMALYSFDEMMSTIPEAGGDKFDDFTDNPFVKTTDEPVSTFSVDADGASYAIMRRYLTYGYNINPSSVRIEEFLNYFTFNYTAPKGDDHVSIGAEVGDCPWNTGHHLLQLGIKGKELTADEMPRANFVFLVDVSGSMSSSDKLDFLASPFTYTDNRGQGVDWAFQGSVESAALYGKPWFMEADVRTCLSRPISECMPFADPVVNRAYDGPVWLGPKDVPGSLGQMKKALARVLTHNTAVWWFDMWGGWYRDPQFMAFHEKAAALYQEHVFSGGSERPPRPMMTGRTWGRSFRASSR